MRKVMFSQVTSKSLNLSISMFHTCPLRIYESHICSTKSLNLITLLQKTYINLFFLIILSHNSKPLVEINESSTWSLLLLLILSHIFKKQVHGERKRCVALKTRTADWRFAWIQIKATIKRKKKVPLFCLTRNKTRDFTILKSELLLIKKKEKEKPYPSDFNTSIQLVIFRRRN